MENSKTSDLLYLISLMSHNLSNKFSIDVPIFLVSAYYKFKISVYTEM